MLVLIRNHGCDDTTTGLAEFKTKEELDNFIKIIINLNNNSQYACMPVIGLYEIDSDKIKLLTDNMEVEDKRNIVYLNGEKYILSLEEYENIYDLEKIENDLIKQYYIKEIF